MIYDIPEIVYMRYYMIYDIPEMIYEIVHDIHHRRRYIVE